jgi:DNA transposition AAA+ family ATPase
MTADEKALVAELKAWHEARESSLDETARKVGVGASTLSELMSGEYRGSGAEVFAKIGRFLEFEKRRSDRKSVV